MIRAYRARLALAQGDHAEVAAWRAALKRLSPEESPTAQGIEALTLARILIAEQRCKANRADAEHARAILVGARESASAAGQIERLIEIDVLTALLDQSCGRREQALIALASALTQAEASGYARLFLDEGAPLLPLLETQSPQNPRVAAYARQLLAMLRHELVRHANPKSAVLAFGDKLVEELSEREIDVLQLVASGASNHEIADALTISIGTVKSHLNHILGKLDARNRTEAVARAREIGLLTIL